MKIIVKIGWVKNKYSQNNNVRQTVGYLGLQNEKKIIIVQCSDAQTENVIVQVGVVICLFTTCYSIV